ncbi:hypothetical protein GGR58DRAFT_497415 [Xylaria digitata]|nr:hypothetical protein GGR58DRAFT_497415 [Xylaria digitata]
MPHRYGASWETFTSRKTGKNYSISSATTDGFGEFISLAFNQTVSKGVALPHRQLIHLDYLIYNSNLTQVANNFAASVTNQIRSADPGGNNNVTMSPGQAFYQETYFHVE